MNAFLYGYALISFACLFWGLLSGACDDDFKLRLGIILFPMYLLGYGIAKIMFYEIGK